MASRHSAFKQADATKALRAAVRAGLKPSGYEIGPDGTIRVLLGSGGTPSGNSFDEAM